MGIKEVKEALLNLVNDGFNRRYIDEDGYSNISQGLNRADTASEVAAVVGDYSKYLYFADSEKTIDLIKHSFTPEIWKSAGVLFNPTTITDHSIECKLAICDGSVETLQIGRSNVDYWGNVRLTAKNAIANVMGSQYPVQAYGDNTEIYLYGSSIVYAHDKAHVDLEETSRAILYDNATAEACDCTFVESRGESTGISAFGQAQILISAGGCDINMTDWTRVAVLNEDGRRLGRVRVKMSDESVLYLESKKAAVVERNIAPAADIASGLVLYGDQISTPVDRMLDIVIPFYKKPSKTFSIKYVQQDTIDVLKVKVAPYLPESFLGVLKDVKTEEELCKRIAPVLPDMVAQGLTGDFLRKTFSEKALMTANIHTGMDFNWSLGYSWVKEDGTHYIFNNEVVDMRLYPDRVWAFGHALVLTNNPEDKVVVGQSANAIVWRKGQVRGVGDGNILGLDSAEIIAQRYTHVDLVDNSRCEASDQAMVEAYDHASLRGTDHTTLILHGQSITTMDGNSRALALDDCKVTVDGHAEVAFPAKEFGTRPEIKVLSNEATLRGLISKQDVDSYMDSLRKCVSAEHRKAAGLGR